MAKQIEPRVLKGFRDFLPEQEAERLRIMHLLQSVYEAHGFVPIDTPILEYSEILLGKSGGATDKQVYRFEDSGGRDIAMRYDLTVPFARYMATHAPELGLPFKRYHMAKVYRGEKPQRGRYREFVQCDFDIVGTESGSADLEVILLTDAAFAAMDVGGARVHIAHRGILHSLLAELGASQAASEEALRVVDKFRKVGEKKVGEQLSDLLGGAASTRVMSLITLTGKNESILEQMREIVPSATESLDRVELIVAGATEAGVGERLVVDPTIARGHDYYTGMVFETFLERLPEIGSVCGGGRYDDLAGLYTKQRLPGVGGSIGLDRLMAALEVLGEDADGGSAADALLLCFEGVSVGHYHQIARELRGAGFRVEVYPDAKKLGQQFAYAEKRKIPFAIILGPDEVEAGTLTIRDLQTRESRDNVDHSDVASVLRELLGKERR